MTGALSAQEILESFLRHEMTHQEAADALIAALVAEKAGGMPVRLGLRKPEAITLTASDLARTEVLLGEIDRRLSAPHDATSDQG